MLKVAQETKHQPKIKALQQNVVIWSSKLMEAENTHKCIWMLFKRCLCLLASRPNERSDEPADPALEIFKQASALSKVSIMLKQHIETFLMSLYLDMDNIDHITGTYIQIKLL